MKTYKWLQRITIAALAVGVVASPLSGVAFAGTTGVDPSIGATASMYHVGDPVTWNLSLENQGTEDIVVDIWDILPNGARVDLAEDVRIAVGASWDHTLSGAYVVSAADVMHIAPDRDAIESGLYYDGLTVTSRSRAYGNVWESSQVIQPALSIETLVDFDGDGTFTAAEANLAGTAATWKVVVTNSGDSKVTGVMLSDGNEHAYGGPYDLEAGATREFAYVETIAATKTLNVTVSGIDDLGSAVGPVSDGAAVTADVLSLSVDKTVDFNGDEQFSDVETGESGTTALWRIAVTNSGTLPLANVMLSDGSWSEGPITLAAGETRVFFHETSVDETTVNTVTVSGLDAQQRPVGPVSDSATAEVEEETAYPDLQITKTADVTDAIANDIITYTVSYRNVGDGVALGYLIEDDFDERYVDVQNAAGGSVSGGRIVWTSDRALEPGEAGSITYTVKVKSAENLPVGSTNVDNVVTIATEGDSGAENNRASERVVIDNAFLPYTPPTTPKTQATPAPQAEPFLPYTGDNGLLTLSLAVLLAAVGFVIRAIDPRRAL